MVDNIRKEVPECYPTAFLIVRRGSGAHLEYDTSQGVKGEEANRTLALEQDSDDLVLCASIYISAEDVSKT